MLILVSIDNVSQCKNSLQFSTDLSEPAISFYKMRGVVDL